MNSDLIKGSHCEVKAQNAAWGWESTTDAEMKSPTGGCVQLNGKEARTDNRGWAALACDQNWLKKEKRKVRCLSTHKDK